MQLVNPSEVAMAVRIAAAILMMVLMVSFFIVLDDLKCVVISVSDAGWAVAWYSLRAASGSVVVRAVRESSGRSRSSSG